jgi:hypothetical protein
MPRKAPASSNDPTPSRPEGIARSVAVMIGVVSPSTKTSSRPVERVRTSRAVCQARSFRAGRSLLSSIRRQHQQAGDP